MNANLDGMIRAVAEAKNLYVAGVWLKAFTSEVENYGEGELEEALSLLWTALLENSADDLNHESPNNHGYLICPPEKVVATDLCNRIQFRATPRENFAELKKTADRLFGFGRRDGYQMKPKAVQQVMDDFEERFGIISKLTAKHRMMILLHDAGPIDAGGELLFHYYSKVDAFIAHMAFYPSSMRYFLVSIMGVGEEIAVLLAKALCFAAFRADHTTYSYDHVTVPEDIYPLLSACGHEVNDSQKTVDLLEKSLGLALMLDSPYGGGLTTKRKNDMGKEKAEAHRKLLQVVLGGEKHD